MGDEIGSGELGRREKKHTLFACGLADLKTHVWKEGLRTSPWAYVLRRASSCEDHTACMEALS